MSTSTVRSTAPRWVASPFGAATWRRTVHLLADLPVATVAFCLAMVAVATAGGLAVTVVGIPLLVATLLGARAYARFERARARVFLGLDVPAPDVPAAGWHPRTWLPVLRDGGTWAALLHAIVAFPVAVANFVITVSGWTTAAACVAAPLAVPWQDVTLPFGSQHVGSALAAAVLEVAGLALLAAMPAVVTALAALDGLLVKSLLGARHTAAGS